MMSRIVKITPRDTADLGLKPFDSNIFLRRIAVWDNTKQTVKQWKTPPSCKTSYNHSLVLQPKFASTSITVTPEDTIDCGRRLAQANPVLLNFSDDAFAGGYVGRGSGAQEESLFRRSDYCNTLLTSFYPLGRLEAVYSPTVTVFKAAEEEDWVPMEPVRLAFIACPAIKRPHLVNEGLTDADAELFRRKIRLVLQTAYTKGHDTLVLGAWGTGAFGCPPQHVAELFKEELQACEGAFKTVCFAIKKTPDTHEGNRFYNAFEVFSAVFTDPIQHQHPA
jgi:uncharacterized protein (TIGR02452 family)